MSYRSIKRVLGETNLERKCRMLFGACLLLLITGSFWFYGARTQKIVYEKNRITSQHLVYAVLLKYHWLRWESMPEYKELAADVSDDLENFKYQAKILALEPSNRPDSIVELPANDEERAILERLKRRYDEQVALLNEQARAATPAAEPGVTPIESDPTMPQAALFELPPVIEERPLRDQGEYHYYQPVYWKRSCYICHKAFWQTGALSAGDAQGVVEPFRAVKIVVPDRETQQDLAKNWAILFTTAIITVFLSMIALYVIVKYVIVKPLKHLRDVSDEVSRGNTALRADIHTNDEFEDLADSFNRMLRHLIDAQEQLRTVNADLDAKVDQLAQANMQLYEMNRLKSDFLANMSHELRTPLNSIIGFSDVLKGIDALDNKQQRYVLNIQKSGRVLLEMINDILDLAKLEAGKMDLRPSEFRIDAIVAAQCDMVRALTEQKNIDLEVHVDARTEPMFQDQSKVQQILTNLLSNAIKFTPEGGRIVVSARRLPTGMLKLSVSDTGIGIAQEDREVIFEKFRQAVRKTGDNLTREYSGTGLGLSIVKELCKLLGGEIAFTSELGVGSEFTVTLPWRIPEPARRESELAGKLDELTRPRRPELPPRGDDDPHEPAAPAATEASG